MGEAFYLLYHMEFRNTLTAAQAIIGKRLDKVGWIESHNYHKCLIKYRKPWTLIIGDKVEDVIWCIGSLDVNEEVRYVVLICGINNIDKNIPADIVKGIKYAIHLVKCKFNNCKVVVSGSLSRDCRPGIWRNKIRSVNIQIKYAIGKMNINSVTYIDPDHTQQVVH